MSVDSATGRGKKSTRDQLMANDKCKMLNGQREEWRVGNVFIVKNGRFAANLENAGKTSVHNLSV